RQPMLRQRSLRSPKNKLDPGLIWNKRRPLSILITIFSKPATNYFLRGRSRDAITTLHERPHYRRRQLTILRNRGTRPSARLAPALHCNRQRDSLPPRRENTWVPRRSLFPPTSERRSLAS